MEDLSPIEQELAQLYARELSDQGGGEPPLAEVEATTKRVVGLIDVLAFTVGRLWYGLLVMLGADAGAVGRQDEAGAWRDDE